jgi:hypothetical protein
LGRTGGIRHQTGKIIENAIGTGGHNITSLLLDLLIHQVGAPGDLRNP